MQAQNFIAAINQLCDQKKIPRERVLDAVKDALKAAYRKDFGSREQNIEILLDEKSGRATVLLVKTVVSQIENRVAELTLAEARKIKKDIKEGDKIKIDVTPIDYGRIASQSAKQVIIQKIQEAEREAVFAEYKDREDELLNALVHRTEGRFVYLELDRTTAILEPRDQIPRERYQAGQRIKVYLEKVELTPKGPMLRVSRTHPRLIFRLLDLEVPEVRNETVVIKAIARDAGVRCKIIVDSVDDNVDPVGACVGQKGVRIQNITDEVGGERIDVIEWSDDFDTLLRETLSPAKIEYINKIESEKRVEVYVNEDQRALAIGKAGQNVRLASEILDWEIDVLNASEISDDNVLADSEAKADPEAKVEQGATGATATGQSDSGDDGSKPAGQKKTKAKKGEKKADEQETVADQGKSDKAEGESAEKTEKSATESISSDQDKTEKSEGESAPEKETEEKK